MFGTAICGGLCGNLSIDRIHTTDLWLYFSGPGLLYIGHSSFVLDWILYYESLTNLVTVDVDLLILTPLDVVGIILEYTDLAGGVAVLGMVVYCFLPESKELDLEEEDRKLEGYLRENGVVIGR